MNGGNAKARITVRVVGKRFGQLQMSQDINLTVSEREIGVEGKLITEPQEGVAMVFQHFVLFPWKTVQDKLGYGTQQRYRLDRALAVGPSVLLMDEPFAAEDAQSHETLQFELICIWEDRPTTMVFVIQSIEEAVLMGDRVMVLKGWPSTVFETIEVDLHHPRSRDTLAELRFAEIHEHVWSPLMDESRAAELELEC